MGIYREIRTAPEGGTYDLQRESLPADGYFVGGVAKPLVYSGPKQLGQVTLYSFIRGLSARYVGWWTDSETGKLWVDGSDWYQSLPAALASARARGELAIYDVANESEIRL